MLQSYASTAMTANKPKPKAKSKAKKKLSDKQMARKGFAAGFKDAKVY